MNYGTSVQAIAQANGITDPTLISVGQQLVIPDPGSGFAALPSVGQGQPAGIGQAANCSRFALTSPLEGMALGPVTFYWEPALGATSYRVNIYSPEGALWYSATTSGAETNIPLDTKQFGMGYSFQLDVEALVNGAQLCRTSVCRWLALPADTI
jgi:LysM repeat protein